VGTAVGDETADVEGATVLLDGIALDDDPTALMLVVDSTTLLDDTAEDDGATLPDDDTATEADELALATKGRSTATIRRS
jgi:hypothetical protein